MRIYYDLLEKTEEGIEPEFIRADVTGKAQTEMDAVQADMEAVMQGKSYTIKKHLCRHEESGDCTLELVKDTG